MARGAIVYLSQVRHSSYGRSSLALLQRSLSLLFQNYNERQRDDVIIFHAGDFTPSIQRRVLEPYPGRPIRFHSLAGTEYWRVPAGLPPPSEWNFRMYSVGYRHMIRFFTVGLWRLAASLGYSHVMRMDEDSMLKSRVDDNLFARMERRGLEYAFRQWTHESADSISRDAFYAAVRTYLVANDVSPQWRHAAVLQVLVAGPTAMAGAVEGQVLVAVDPAHR